MCVFQGMACGMPCKVNLVQAQGEPAVHCHRLGWLQRGLTCDLNALTAGLPSAITLRQAATGGAGQRLWGRPCNRGDITLSSSTAAYRLWHASWPKAKPGKRGAATAPSSTHRAAHVLVSQLHTLHVLLLLNQQVAWKGGQGRGSACWVTSAVCISPASMQTAMSTAPWLP